ncbi:MAG TPA: 50S ribosomal protein L25 [Candidatus Saccharimonadales bacterium]|nr:50S ribosomal protein L25 [Candidatus Saccharimonadales bacterium]
MSDDKISLALEPRTVLGKAVKHLRTEGTIPAVIHDHGKESVIVQGEYMALLKVWQQAGQHHPVNLKAGDKTYTALIKTVDMDPKKHQLRHVVFNAVRANEKVEAAVPIHARYDEGNESAPAERNGLIVLSHLDSVQVKAVPAKLPDFLEYNAEKLVEVGDSITVADLIVPADVEIVTEPEHSIASVYEPSALQAANEAAAGEAEDATASDTVADTETGSTKGGEAEGAEAAA